MHQIPIVVDQSLFYSLTKLSSQDVPFEGTLVDDWKHVYSSHDARKMVCNNDANITSRLLAGEIKWFVMSILLWVHKQDLPPPIPNERTPSPPPQ